MSYRHWMAGVAVAAMFAVTTPAAAVAGSPIALRGDLDAIVAAGPASALVEVRDGPRTIRLTSGSARYGRAEPVDPRGRFRAGSVTKMVVATAVLQLVSEHRLALADPVDRWLPGLLPAGNGITVRELLDHTSGLFDYTATLPLHPPTGYLPLRWTTWTPRDLVARATAQPTLFRPGTDFAYSSTGYIVLGMLIERVTGEPYGQEISRRILRPLGLKDTTFPGTDPRIHGPHAHAYLPDGAGGVIDITEYNPSVMGASGDLVTTAADLNRFTTALLAGRLLPPAQLRRMKSVVPPSTRGLGLELVSLPCGTAYGHKGDALGASTWTFATGPGHTVTLSVTWGTNRPGQAAVTALIEDALCRAA
jgi:D-alanyl-D-alanine carboxypeptidase